MTSVFMFFASTTHEVGDNEIVNQLLRSKYKEKAARNYILIVNTTSGCGSCLRMVDAFIGNHINDKRFIFVVPFTSEKAMNISLGKKILNSPNVIVDKKNLAIEKGLVNTIPTVFFVKNGVITKKILLEAESISRLLNSLE